MRFALNANTRRLERALAKFPRQTIKNVGFNLKVAARDITDEARATHRYNTKNGVLEKATQWEVNTAKLIAAVGLNTKLAPYALSIHDGSKAHVIQARKKKALRFIKNGKIRFAKKIMHPGTEPDRFINQAAITKAENTKRLMYKAVKKAAEGSFI